ncbi:MAG TPA: cbb3-type cytochrome c oxidase subunit 3 [Gemmatimonadaceae bacterium]|nr:cbb3-type cytochrome c oxidase subunit 3 [Gemmatimonadaceae bacterium]
MSLTEIMSGAGLSRYAEIALVLFFLAFLVILWRIYAPSRRRALERASRLPLDDETRTPPTDRGD